jgi:hypothetical protein
LEPITFSEPIKFDVISLAKIAPAIDRRKTLLAVRGHDDGLFIFGLARTNTIRRNVLLSEPLFVPREDYGPVVVTVTDPGVLKIDVGSRRVAGLNKGRVSLTENSLAVFHGGRVFELIAAYAQGTGLDVASYTGILGRALISLVERGHGGIVLVLPDDDREYLEIRYAAAERATCLRDAIEFRAGESLGPSCRAYVQVSGQPRPDPKTLELQFSRERAVEEHVFFDDASTFAADLASIDGALVLSSDLTILGFGAHIKCPQDEIQAKAAMDLPGTKLVESPLKSLGTRHNSAARLCYHRPKTLAFVVSQDGLVSVLLRDSKQAFVTLWRPAALEWHC